MEAHALGYHEKVTNVTRILKDSPHWPHLQASSSSVTVYSVQDCSLVGKR